MLLNLPAHGLLGGLPGVLVVLGIVAFVAAAGFLGAALWAFTLGLAAVLWLVGMPLWLWWIFVPLALVANVPILRRLVASDRIMGFVRRAGLLPTISDTEREAIEAGDVWIDGALFSGKPDLQSLSNAPWPTLREPERAFLDGPVDAVCRMTDDWEVWRRRDLSKEVWDFLKRERFFGMIVPEEFDGLGFSATAHSEVIQRLATRSLPLAITVMVPNSLGPAELLIHYGTDAQKRRWLPPLARGEELPCFALTEPAAGSDAAAMQSEGVVFRGEDGELWLRLSWNKRYITLAAVATVLGLAFKLEDPEGLLDGATRHWGITCALVPASTPGVELGRRHDPLGVPFYNCPTRGEDVVVKLEDAVIGGRAGIGKGWRMLMECLAAGRGVSLPATSTGGAKLTAHAVGAYAAVRKQFGLEIGKFEGIEEKLARIAGHTWLLDGARRLVTGGIDAGAKPPVVTAMAKYWFTELFREVINDGMDVQGGAAISRGPNNTIAHAYAGTPISITVEGANVLTRTLMVFGQGAIRCHPFAFREIEALRTGDKAAFDHAFWGHVGHVVRNGVRSVLLSVTRGRLAKAPVSGPTATYWRRLSWASATFALYADLAMAGLGGDLKRKEKITGRFADVFGWLLLITGALRRFEAEGRKAEDLPLLGWSCEHGFARIRDAMQGLCRNIRIPGVTWLLHGPVALWGRMNPIGHGPDDALGSKAARAVLEAGEARTRLTDAVFVAADESYGLARLQRAFDACTRAAPAVRKVKDAIRRKDLPRGKILDVLDDAARQGVVTLDEAAAIREAETERDQAIQVDSFGLEEYLRPGESALEEAAGHS